MPTNIIFTWQLSSIPSKNVTWDTLEQRKLSQIFYFWCGVIAPPGFVRVRVVAGNRNIKLRISRKSVALGIHETKRKLQYFYSIKMLKI